MEFLDLKTLHVSFITITAATSIALFFLFYIIRDEPAMPFWFLHKILVIIGIASISLRSSLPTELSIIVTNGAIMSAYLFLWAGTRTFFKRKMNWWLGVIPICIAAGPILWYTFEIPSALDRSFYSALVYCLFSCLTAYEFLKGNSLYQKAVGYVFIGNSLCFVWFLLVIPLDLIEPYFYGVKIEALRIQLLMGSFVDAFYAVSIVLIVYERLNDKAHKIATELKELNDEQKQFMLMLSHEFKNPLSAISRSAEYLEASLSPLPESQQKRLSNIQERISALNTLVNMFLRHESERHAYNNYSQDRLSFEKIWQEVESYFDRHLVEDRIELHMAETSKFLTGDLTLLSSALCTVIDNGLKYSDEDKKVIVRFDYNDESAEISVQDSGVGIPAKDLEIIPKRFYRSDNVRNRPGSGLGLALAQWAVRQHHGTMEIKSQQNIGTHVTLYLPS